MKSTFELHFSIGQVGLIFGMGDTWVRERVNAGDFGEVLDLNGSVRIPASGIKDYADSHKRVYSIEIKARNKGELRRKMRKPEAGRLDGWKPIVAEGGPGEDAAS